MSETPQLRIAIVGAGIAGLATAIALKNHPGIDVQIFEKANKLQEIGASIALGPNGMRTLERLGIHEALSDDTAFRNHSGHPMIYRHWATNEIVSADNYQGEVAYEHQTSRFYRAHLQQALLSHVDPSRIHLSKAFSSVLKDSSTGTLDVAFADGSTATADVLLGADGISSAVRRSFVPESTNKWTGWVAFRSVFDANLLPRTIGTALDEANHWWAPERTFFASKLGGNLFTIVGGWHSDPGDPKALYKDAVWNSDGNLDEVKELYKNWHPAVRQMIDAAPYVRQYPNTYASALDTWVHGGGLVTFAGDAAHAHGGAFAAGGSLALDDAYAFALAITHTFPVGAPKPSEQEIRDALLLYQQTRKPHTDRVLSVVHENNKKITARIGKTESDEQLRKRMSSRQDVSWLQEHDVVGAFESAVSSLSKPDQAQARL